MKKKTQCLLCDLCMYSYKILFDHFMKSNVMDYRTYALSDRAVCLDLNFSQVAHEISSVEAPKGGKLTDDLCINISFIQLPSHICPNFVFCLSVVCEKS